MKEASINDLRVGESALINQLKVHGAMRRRLLDLGITAETKVECVGESPHGDPRAYLIRGAVIAIRKIDGEKIIIAQTSPQNIHIS